MRHNFLYSLRNWRYCLAISWFRSSRLSKAHSLFNAIVLKSPKTTVSLVGRLTMKRPALCCFTLSMKFYSHFCPSGEKWRFCWTLSISYNLYNWLSTLSGSVRLQTDSLRFCWLQLTFPPTIHPRWVFWSIEKLLFTYFDLIYAQQNSKILWAKQQVYGSEHIELFVHQL